MLPTIVSILLLGVLCYQDFRHRQISLVILIALFVLLFLSAYHIHSSLIVTAKNFSINFGFVIIQLIFLYSYLFIKTQKLQPILDIYIGKGDVIFLIVACMAFSTVLFMLFYMVSLVVALISTGINNRLSNTKMTEIPLAGVMALLMGIIMSMRLWHSPLNFYDDSYWIHLIKM